MPIDELVTCGNITDPRIQFEVDVASALTIVFKSNGNNEFQGVVLYILEIDPSVRNLFSYNVYGSFYLLAKIAS